MNNDTHKLADSSPAKSPTMTRAGMAGWTFANACILGIGAWMVFSSAGAPMTQRVEAGTPPGPSAANRGATADDMTRALDSGNQRAEMVSELRALRGDVAELKAIISGGRMRTEVTNLSELRIDYAKLRDAARGQ